MKDGSSSCARAKSAGNADIDERAVRGRAEQLAALGEPRQDLALERAGDRLDAVQHPAAHEVDAGIDRLRRCCPSPGSRAPGLLSSWTRP